MKLSSVIFLGLSALAAADQRILAIPDDVELPQNDDSALLNLHKQLIDIPSISLNESHVSEFLAEHLRGLNYHVELLGEKERPNIYAYKGEKDASKVLLTSHIDTVPPYIPYSLKGDRIYGRGAVDAKSCVAAQITAVEELLKDGEVQPEDVALLYVVGEEISGNGGMRVVNDLLKKQWNTAIFGEPTELKLGVGHKGFGTIRITVKGKASHSGYPELGISANEILVDALYELSHSTLPKSPLLGPSTLNIGQMHGGIAANIVPADANAVVTIRIAADEEEVQKVVSSVLEKYEHLTFTFDSRPPQLLDYKVDGFESIVLAYSTDVPYLTGDFKKYLYGPGSIHVAHAPDEYVTVQDLEASVEGYKKLVKLAL
ncbi:Peptidase M20 domain-containing protein [Yarrowia sp. B02]|nr:Peptidase M20 domain-containing protein [Yarrowia sp. B02]